jgi:hypothetical protein
VVVVVAAAAGVTRVVLLMGIILVAQVDRVEQPALMPAVAAAPEMQIRQTAELTAAQVGMPDRPAERVAETPALRMETAREEQPDQALPLVKEEKVAFRAWAPLLPVQVVVDYTETRHYLNSFWAAVVVAVADRILGRSPDRLVEMPEVLSQLPQTQ